MQTNDRERSGSNKDDKRELRRQRRIKSQRKAYITMVFVLVVLVAGIAGGIWFIGSQIELKMQQETDTEFIQTEEVVDEIVQNSEEENIDNEVEEQIEYTDAMVLDEVVEAIISEMTLEEKVAGLFVVTPESITGVSKAVQAGEGTKKALEQYSVGGLIYSKQNIQSEEQIKMMVQNSKMFSKYPLFFVADENVGDSAQLASYGFNLNLSSIENLADGNGISICAKDFPCADTGSYEKQNGLPVVNKSLEELKQMEIVPFISAIENEVDMIMVGHMALPQVVGDNTSVTMSKEVITDLLRMELGFNGVVITDAMNVSAITEYYGADEVAIRAFKAGADMVLMPENFETAYKGVIAAVQEGTISEERIDDSLKRVFRIKYADSVGE